jgi:hypothetical protein
MAFRTLEKQFLQACLPQITPKSRRGFVSFLTLPICGAFLVGGVLGKPPWAGASASLWVATFLDLDRQACDILRTYYRIFGSTYSFSVKFSTVSKVVW